MKIVAVVDLGSNSFKVSVVNMIDQAELARMTESIRIFPESATAVTLTSEKIKAATEAVSRLVAFARAKNAEKIILLGTSALRDCTNRSEFSDALLKATGLSLLTVSGEVEARLAAEGIRSDPALAPYQRFVAFDLGGGSLEVVEMRGRSCTLAKSFPLGSVRLTHSMLQGAGSIIGQGQQEYFQQEVRNALEPFVPAHAAENSIIIGAGGAFAVIALYLEAIGEKPVAGRLPVLRIRELKDKICSLTPDQRRSIPGIPVDRLDIMPAALLTICVLADLCQAESFYLTHYGVRHGMVQILKRDTGGLI